jgi:DNA-binding transcriptional LysR family regulator
VFEPALLRSFLVVAETGSFTGAARLLGLRQPTVSQHVRRLEEAGGRLLFGASEDFVLGQLPAILRQFRRSHPLVDLELTVELAETLHERLRAGELDLVLGKRLPGDPAGTPLWRERLVWIAAPGFRPDPAAPVPLIAYPAPSITRARALGVLRRHGRQWRITCTSGSLNGVRAAALAGLGVTVHARGLIPDGLAELPAPHGLPDPGEVEFVLSARRSPLTGPAAALAEAIRDGVHQLHDPS